jgi:SAM-dependent methyltransferase
MTDYSYVGSELDIFSRASNWKAYYEQLIRSYIGREVLEVGAGIGATTLTLCRGNIARWVCLEPDPALASKISHLIESGQLPKCCQVQTGTLSDLRPSETFETILYIDVLEHIKDDQSEIKLAAEHLKTGGFLIVLSPAHQRLFTPFDAKIGHYRRYDKSSLLAIMPENLKCHRLYYVDSIGAVASLGNRYILGSSMPNPRQIALWDKVLIPLSRIFDPLSRFSIGKTIIGIWQKTS